MKIKLKDKDNPITQMWCFNSNGYSSDIINKINSGKQVEVEGVPKSAWEYIEEVKIVKEVKIIKKKKKKEDQ